MHPWIAATCESYAAAITANSKQHASTIRPTAPTTPGYLEEELPLFPFIVDMVLCTYKQCCVDTPHSIGTPGSVLHNLRGNTIEHHDPIQVCAGCGWFEPDSRSIFTPCYPESSASIRATTPKTPGYLEEEHPLFPLIVDAIICTCFRCEINTPHDLGLSMDKYEPIDALPRSHWYFRPHHDTVAAFHRQINGCECCGWPKLDPCGSRFFYMEAPVHRPFGGW